MQIVLVYFEMSAVPDTSEVNGISFVVLTLKEKLHLILKKQLCSVGFSLVPKLFVL